MNARRFILLMMLGGAMLCGGLKGLAMIIQDEQRDESTAARTGDQLRVHMSSRDAIRYTLDGSEPTKERGTILGKSMDMVVNGDSTIQQLRFVSIGQPFILQVRVQSAR